MCDVSGKTIINNVYSNIEEANSAIGSLILVDGKKLGVCNCDWLDNIGEELEESMEMLREIMRRVYKIDIPEPDEDEVA